MRMFSWKQNLSWVAAGVMAAAFAAPVSAGTVYHWTTENGTEAFSDDAKRIPARYRAVAERRYMRNLEDYPRFTIAHTAGDRSYSERVFARLDSLRSAARPVEVGVRGHGRGVAFEVAVGNGDQISVPVGRGLGAPLRTSSHRIQRADSIATQHVRVTRQGEKVVAVTVGKRNEGPIAERIRR